MGNIRKLMITVDVEAQTGRAEKNHLDRLIWGKFPEGRCGIGEMMDVADKHAAKITMFLDYCEEHLYGDALLDVGREIHRRGHDLQLHAHLDFLSKDWWSKNSPNKRTVSLNEVDEYQAQCTFDFLCDAQVRATGVAPIAYRGGGYRFNKYTLNAAYKNGVLLHSSFNHARPTSYPGDIKRSKQFLWSNGCYEIPISIIQGNNCPLQEFNFNYSYFPNATRMVECLDRFYQQMGDDAIAVLVLHSWSFLELVNKKYFEHIIPEQMLRFDAFLGMIKGRIDIINSHQAMDLISNKQVDLDISVEISDLTDVKAPSHDNTNSKSVIMSSLDCVESDKNVIKCPICNTPPSFENGKVNRMCPVCKSVERQRIFYRIYQNNFKIKQYITGKRGLLISPSYSEINIFQKVLPSELITIDIRPEAGANICADISKSIPFEDDSFDFIYASYVLTCLKDLEEALRELSRVLKPNGVLFTIDPIFGNKTKEFKNMERITSYYGKDNYDKFGVGVFREFGIEDLSHTLSQFFSASQISSNDVYTDTEMTLFISKKINKDKNNGDVDRGKSNEEIIAQAEQLWAKVNDKDSASEAVKLLQQLFEKGEVRRTAYRLGTAYFLGKGVQKDLEAAYRYLSLVENTRYALYYRGLILCDVSFSGFNLELALKDFSNSMKMGVPNVQIHIDKISRLIKK